MVGLAVLWWYMKLIFSHTFMTICAFSFMNYLFTSFFSFSLGIFPCFLIACCSVTKSSLTLCDPHGLQTARLLCPWGFPARVLEWGAISFSRTSSWPRDQTRVSCIGRRVLYHWATKLAKGTYTNRGRSGGEEGLLGHPGTLGSSPQPQILGPFL